MATSKSERPVGLNVLMSQDAEGNLVFTIDPSVSIGPSSTGKSTTVAKTGGNVLVTEDGLMIGINAYRPLPKA
jgi:hypothetical protein